MFMHLHLEQHSNNFVEDSNASCRILKVRLAGSNFQFADSGHWRSRNRNYPTMKFTMKKHEIHNAKLMS